MINTCQNCEKNIIKEDIELVEKNLKFSFPDEFTSHYLVFNGGVPLRSWWDSYDGFEPIEIAEMKPFKYNKSTNDSPESLIDGCYYEMVGRNVIPTHLIPFGNDWGGNFFCLNKNNGNVVFYTTDSFNPDVSAEKNHESLQKTLAPSFKSFMDKLVVEGDLD